MNVLASTIRNATRNANRRRTVPMRLASPILQHSHVQHSEDFRELLVLERGAHDQYATTGENWHVTENEIFTNKREKASRLGGLYLILVSH